MGERPERKRKENLEVINGLLFCKSLKDNVRIILVPRIKERKKKTIRTLHDYERNIYIFSYKFVYFISRYIIVYVLFKNIANTILQILF